jgi:GNAT superfamily N-acetyltransferase
MKQSTQADIEQSWRDLLGVDDALWSSVTVLHPHGQLGDYAGWYVAWRETGLHVSAPSSAHATEVAALRDTSATELQRPEFWQAFAQRRGLVVIGPGVHHYLDVDPGTSDDVREVDPGALRVLCDLVDPEDWWESSFDDALDDPRTIAFATDAGGAVLTELDGAPRNIGVLVVPDARGRGAGTELGRAAASYAVRAHGYARWRCRDTNVASVRAAERLGFEPYATQLAVRSGS